MTIEINRNTQYTFRINPFQPRNIDRRENKHNARWKHWHTYGSTYEAINALLAAQSEPKQVSK